MSSSLSHLLNSSTILIDLYGVDNDDEVYRELLLDKYLKQIVTESNSSSVLLVYLACEN
jgi:hypothetical protein